MKIIFRIAISCLFLVATAQASFAKKISKYSQEATVQVDGAAVYKAPSFDAPVLDYLDSGKTVVISKKTYPGAGGLGVFYKIKIGKKKYGYIVDTEVKGGGAGVFTPIDNFSNSDSAPVDNAPIYFTRLLGGGVNFINYTDVYEGKTYSSFIPTVSLKASGPNLFFGPPVDLEVSTSMQVPDFFNEFSHSTSGFVIHASAQILAPLKEFNKGLFYYSYGLAMSYENFQVQAIVNDPLDSQDLKLGIKGTVGIAYYVYKFVIKGEANYYYMDPGYISAAAYLQMPF